MNVWKTNLDMPVKNFPDSNIKIRKSHSKYGQHHSLGSDPWALEEKVSWAPASISLRFPTADTVFTAASESCHHDLSTMKGDTLKLQGIINLFFFLKSLLLVFCRSVR